VLVWLLATLAGCGPARQSLPVAPVAASCSSEPTCRIRPVDARTLADRREFSPLDFEGHYVFAVSPDRRRLAAITWPADRVYVGGTLHLIDLRTWTEILPARGINGVVEQIVFGADSQSVYWTRSTAGLGYAMPSAFVLSRYSVPRARLETVTAFPLSFVPRDVRVLPSSGRIAVYGMPMTDFLTAGPPDVLVIDPDGGRQVADIPIPGLTDGWLRGSSAESPNQQYEAGRAWDVARERLYLVHPDADRISVVDLAQGKLVTQVTIHRPVGVLERFLNWLVVPAEAKMASGVVRQAVVSPDGGRLYMTGWRNEVVSKNGTVDWGQIPLGLSVTRLDTLTEERHLDLPVSQVVVSPNGQRVLLAGYRKEPQGGQHGSGLYVLDAADLNQLASFEAGTTFAIEGFGPGGLAYVSRWQASDEMIGVLDLGTLRLGAERKLDGYWNGLISVVAFAR
jgi:hypothetical protein